jgi:hypothetical protein
MKIFLRSRDVASKGAALMIVLALVVLLTGLALAYFSRAGTDRQLAQSSYNDTSADLLARSALDIVVGDFKQEIVNNPTVSYANIQPTPYPIPTPADIFNLIRYSSRNASVSRASNISSADVSSNGRSISTTRWNSHYLIPRGNPGDPSINSSPVPTFTAPDWVLVTAQGPTPSPTPSTVIGRYAFAVYDEGGLLDMNVAGYPTWTGTVASSPSPTPTPWLVNVGRKGILAFADLTALGSYAPPQSQINNIVGWRNYAMTLQPTTTSFGSANFSPDVSGYLNARQDWYGSYLLYFGDPPFSIENLSDKLLASTYPFTSIATYVSNNRTDQSLITRQELLRLQRALNNPPGQFSQNLLQYLGTFSRERNRPAPDWPGLNPAGSLSEGRFNLSNLALVVPNPADCVIAHGRKKGWQTGKNKSHLCGDSPSIHDLFGLYWIRADVRDPGLQTPGLWRYIGNTGVLPGPGGNPNPHHGIDCLRGANQQNDFFQILDYALFHASCETNDNNVDKTFAIGASLIDQSDSGTDCVDSKPVDWGPGCDLDSHVVSNNSEQYATHTTVIEYGHGNGNLTTAYGMEPNYSNDNTNGDCDPGAGGPCNKQPHRPTPAPSPGVNTQVINRTFTTVGELGYGIDSSTAGVPTLKFWDNTTTPPFQYAPVLDFFSYNPISSAYPRAGIVNLYTKNVPVIAAMLKSALKNETLTTPSTAGAISQAEAMNAANAIVTATQSVLAGTAIPAVQQTDLTRAIAGRLANVGSTAAGWTSDEQKEAIARALAEMGQTRTWNLFIDVIAQTGKYKPNAQDLTGSNFVVEGEKRYWLHIALGRDLNPDGSVDVLGTQLEEVIE